MVVMTTQTNNKNELLSDKINNLELAIEKAKDQRFDDYNSRLGEQHKFFRSMLYSIGMIFVVLQGIVAFYQYTNISQQKEEINKMKKDLQETIDKQLGLSSSKPELELYSEGRILNNNSVIDATVKLYTASEEEVKNQRYPFLFNSKNQYKYLTFSLEIKNIGKGKLDNALLLTYSNTPIIPISQKETGDKQWTGVEGFEYVSIMHVGGVTPPNMFNTITVSFRMPNDFNPEATKDLYTIMLKITYGDELDLIRETKFKLRINPNIKVIPSTK